MRSIPEHLIEYQRKLDGGISGLSKEISFFVYAVDPGHRVPAVVEMLMLRPYDTVSNLETSDEYISILTMGKGHPDVLVVEGKDERAGVSEMTRKFGSRIFSVGMNVTDLDETVRILRAAGVRFIKNPGRQKGIRYISTTQSFFTGDTYIYVERSRHNKDYLFFHGAKARNIEREIREALMHKSRLKAYSYMQGLDHVTYRSGHAIWMEAAKELLCCTPYRLATAIETNENDGRMIVLHNGKNRPALLLAHGKSEHSPLEAFITRRGPRIQHLAYAVTDVYKVHGMQKRLKIPFHTDTVLGDPSQHYTHVYSSPSPYTGEVTEYVSRNNREPVFHSGDSLGVDGREYIFA